jgi:hypothetical protein
MAWKRSGVRIPYSPPITLRTLMQRTRTIQLAIPSLYPEGRLMPASCKILCFFVGLVFAASAWGSNPERQIETQPPIELSAPAGTPMFLDGFFPVGVFSQPAESFGKWKSRGINTILEVPQGHDPVAWDHAAQAAGIKIIRRPLANPRDDIGRRDLLAWSHWDEPDASGRIFEWTPLFERTFAEWRRIDPSRKVFLNFAGPDISWFTAREDEYSRRYASHYPRLIATADWIANDLYPSGGWLNPGHQGRIGDVRLIAEPIKAIRRMTDKPQFAFIEASEIERGNVAGARCPTPEEMRAQIWYAIVHGVRGLFYFPAVVGTRGFRFDGAPPEIVAEMTRQNSLLGRLGPVLQGPIDPPEIGIEVPPPLEAGWRRASGAGLFIVVNPTRDRVSGASMSLTGLPKASRASVLDSARALPIRGGRLEDDFAPLAVHLYIVPAP